MRQVKALILFLISSSFCAASDKVLWVELSGDITYRDLETKCERSSTWPLISLSAEVTGSTISRAKLSDRWAPLTQETIEFAANELSGIVPFEDPSGELWAAEISLSPRLTSWIMLHMGDTVCDPPRPLSTVESAPLRFAFDITSLGPDPANTISPVVKFKGTRNDGRSYEASLRFLQTLPSHARR